MFSDASLFAVSGVKRIEKNIILSDGLCVIRKIANFIRSNHKSVGKLLQK